MLALTGTPTAIGREYGEACRDEILANLKELVFREGYEPLPRREPEFQAWVRRQEGLLSKHWPWLLEEIAAVAAGCGVDCEDILLLNLRAWQYEYYGRPPAGGCSSVAVTLTDGTVACAGALDDPVKYYCGPVRVAPDRGYAFISFPITGTSWGNRGLNDAGLAVGISSQLLPGLRVLPHAINQDLAMRVILQTCATVGEVREFCRAFPFTMNLVCVDTPGDIFCAHQTAAGLFELPVTDGRCALTNHVCDDAIVHQLCGMGVTEFPQTPTTRARRGKLVEFCRRRNRNCTANDVLALVGRRDDADKGSIHNKGTIVLTLANPGGEVHGFRIRQPQASTGNAEFARMEI